LSTAGRRKTSTDARFGISSNTHQAENMKRKIGGYGISGDY
jgi:hypothetical protein